MYPVILLIVGGIFMVAAIREKHKELGELLIDQMNGAQSFVRWIFAFLLLGLLGLIKPVKPLAQAMMFFVLLVMALTNSKRGDLVSKAQSQIEPGEKATKSGLQDGLRGLSSE